MSSITNRLKCLDTKKGAKTWKVTKTRMITPKKAKSNQFNGVTKIYRTYIEVKENTISIIIILF